MRIALDGTPLVGQRTGIGHTTALLAGSLAADPALEVSAYVVSRHGRGLMTDLPSPRIRVAASPLPARVTHALWSVVGWPHIEHWTGPVDVVHATNYVAPPARAPVVVTVNDLTFVHHPELCTPATLRYPRLIRRALARGVAVHTPTRFVAEEVADAFALDPARIHTIPWGVEHIEGDAAVGRRLAGTDRFVLALGTVEPRKNLPVLVRAFGRIAAECPDVKLVVAGPDGWDAARFGDACAQVPPDRMVRLGYVDAPTRAGLLAAASVFAYPSVYEGFGIPPLEAMAAGTPVVAGRAGSLPEVLGDAALLVDPHDVDALAGALSLLLTDGEAARALEAAGAQHVKRYTWDATTSAFVDLYRSLARS